MVCPGRLVGGVLVCGWPARRDRPPLHPLHGPLWRGRRLQAFNSTAGGVVNSCRLSNSTVGGVEAVADSLTPPAVLLESLQPFTTPPVVELKTCSRLPPTEVMEWVEWWSALAVLTPPLHHPWWSGKLLQVFNSTAGGVVDGCRFLTPPLVEWQTAAGFPTPPLVELKTCSRLPLHQRWS